MKAKFLKINFFSFHENIIVFVEIQRNYFISVPEFTAISLELHCNLLGECAIRQIKSFIFYLITKHILNKLNFSFKFDFSKYFKITQIN